MSKSGITFKGRWMRFVTHAHLFQLPQIASTLRWSKGMEKDLKQFGRKIDDIKSIRQAMYLTTVATISVALAKRFDLIKDKDIYQSVKESLLIMSRGEISQIDGKFALLINGIQMSDKPFISSMYILHAMNIFNVPQCDLEQLNSYVSMLTELDDLYRENALFSGDSSYKEDFSKETADYVMSTLANEFVSALEEMLQSTRELDLLDKLDA